jgi:RNA polymerase sigma factor (sigma-70 family)
MTYLDPSAASPPLDRRGAREARSERRQRRRAEHAEGAPAGPGRSLLWATWTENRTYYHCLCLRWVRGNRHDAEDVMSEAAIKLMELDLRAAAEVHNPRSWIARVLHNLCADLGRKTIRARAIEEVCTTIRAAVDELTPDARLHENRVGTRVAEVVEELPECLRSVLVMRLADGLSYKQIAGRLGITDATARKRAQLGRDEVKLRLGKLADPGPARAKPAGANHGA